MMEKATIFIFALLLAVAIANKNSFCDDSNWQPAPTIDGEPAPPIPPIPDSYKTHIVLTSIDPSMEESWITEWFSTQEKKIRVKTDSAVTKGEIIIDYESKESFHIDQNFNDVTGATAYDCRVFDVTKDAQAQMIGNIQTLPNGTLIASANNALQFGPSFTEHYIGFETVRGIPANHWRSCGTLNKGKVGERNLTRDYYFATATWPAPFGQSQNPIQAILNGTYLAFDGSIQTFTQRFDFVKWESPIPADPENFETPKGTICTNRTSTKPIPTIPDDFSFAMEIIRTKRGSQIYNSKIVYDSIANLAKISTPIGWEVHDYMTGIEYSYDVMAQACKMKSIDLNSLDAIVTEGVNGSVIVRMKNVKELFRLVNTTYQYEGQRYVRGILCDVFVGWVRDLSYEGTDRMTDMIYEYYFADINLQEYPEGAAQNLSAVPVKLTVTEPEIDYVVETHYYDFKKSDIGYNFDVTSCYPEDRTQAFQIGFSDGRAVTRAQTISVSGYKEGDERGLVPSKNGGEEMAYEGPTTTTYDALSDQFIEAVFKQISTIEITGLTGVSPIRLQRLRMEYDNGKAMLSGYLLDRPTPIFYYTKLPKTWLIGTSTIGIFYVDSAEDCAKSCLEMSNGMCKSFDVCKYGSSRLRCYRNRRHQFHQGTKLQDRSFCDHYSKTSDDTTPQPTLDDAVVALTNGIYSNKLQVLTPTGPDPDEQEIVQFNATDVKYDILHNPAHTYSMNAFNMSAMEMGYDTQKVPSSARAIYIGESVDECAILCLGERKYICHGFTYNWAKKMCMYSNPLPDATNLKPMTGIWVYQRSALSTNYHYRKGSLYSKPKLPSGSLSATNEEDCARFCDSLGDEQCRGFQYCKDDKMCYTTKERYPESVEVIYNNKKRCTVYGLTTFEDFAVAETRVRIDLRKMNNIKASVYTDMSIRQCAHRCTEHYTNQCKDFLYCGTLDMCVMSVDTFKNIDAIKSNTAWYGPYCDRYERDYFPNEIILDPPTAGNNSNASTLPEIPKVYSTHIEINVPNEKRTTYAREFVDENIGMAAIFTRYEVEQANANLVLMNMTAGTIYQIDLLKMTCVAGKLSAQTPGQLGDFRPTVNGKYAATVAQLMRFGRGYNETYEGQYTVRGVGTNRYRSVMSIQNPKATFSTDYDFANGAWNNPHGDNNVPIRAHVQGVSESGGRHNFERLYNFINFHEGVRSYKVFEIPPNVMCLTNVSFKVPQIPNKFSFRQELISKDTNSTFTSAVYYDGDHKMTRIEYIRIDDSGSNTEPEAVTEIHDYSTGVAFVKNRANGGCQITSIPLNTFDIMSNITNPGENTPKSLQLRDPQQLLYLDDKYQYQGTRWERGILCDVFTSIRGDFKNLSTRKRKYKFEYLFATESWTSITDGVDMASFRAPVRLEINSLTDDQDPYNQVYNFFDWDSSPPAMQQDVQACWKELERTKMNIEFKGPYWGILDSPKVLSKFIDDTHWKIMELGQVNSIRVQGITFDYDDIETSSVYYKFILTGPPPTIHMYQKFPKTLLSVAAKTTISGKTPEQCADICFQYGQTGRPFKCQSFDMLGTRCYLNSHHYSDSDGDRLSTSRSFTHYAKAVDVYPNLKNSDTVMTSLINAVYSDKMIIKAVVKTTVDGSETNEQQDYPAVAVHIKTKVGPEVKAAITKDFDVKKNTIMVDSASQKTLSGIDVMECARRCEAERGFNCESFDYCFSYKICYMNKDHPVDHPDNFETRNGCNLYSRRRIDIMFTQLPGKTVEPKAFLLMRNVATAADCADECLKTRPEGGICRSFHYSDDDRECRLHEDYLYESEDYADNFMNNPPSCVQYTRSPLIDFETPEPRQADYTKLITTDGVRPAECAHLCLQYFGNKCEGFHYNNELARCGFTSVLRNPSHKDIMLSNSSLSADYYSYKMFEPAKPVTTPKTTSKTSPKTTLKPTSCPTCPAVTTSAPCKKPICPMCTTPIAATASPNKSDRNGDDSGYPLWSVLFAGFGMMFAGIFIGVALMYFVSKRRIVTTDQNYILDDYGATES